MRQPLTPPGADLRDFPSMMIDVARLRDSTLAGHENAEVFRVSVLSWCASWHQVPAGSLPDNDNDLARLLGFGREVRSWKRVRRAGGLYGWIICSDGRLYHPVVAEKVHAALKSKQLQRERTEAARAARAAKRMSWSDLQVAEAVGIIDSDDSVTFDTSDDVATDVTHDTSCDVTFTKGREEKEREEERTPPTPPKRGRDDGRRYTVEFIIFWGEYPRKEDKPVAFRAWNSALRRGVKPQTIMDCLYADLPKWAGREPDKIKMPATWLNSDPWDRLDPFSTPLDKPSTSCNTKPAESPPADLFGG